MTRPPLSLLFLFILLFSGCTTPPVHDEPVREDLEFDFPLRNPLLINETTEANELTHTFVPKKDCMFKPRPNMFYNLHDRHGNVASGLLEVDLEAETQEFKIPITGEPPWLFFGAKNPCADGHASRVSGLLEGMQLSGRGLWKFDPNATSNHEANEQIFQDVVTLQLRQGERVTQTTWSVDPFTAWGLTWASVQAPRGADGFWGTTRMSYPDGVLWREDTFSATGVHKAEFEPLQYMPGDYTIEVEATAPVTKDIEITYHIDHSAITEVVCQFGFEWEMCEGE